MCITGKSYHDFIWTIRSIAILGVLLLIGTNASSCQSPSVLGFQLGQNENTLMELGPLVAYFKPPPHPKGISLDGNLVQLVPMEA